MGARAGRGVPLQPARSALRAAAGKRPELARAFMVILGLERFAQFDEIVRAHEAGEQPPLVAWGATPTLFDPTQAPPGGHTAFLWQKVPYALRGSPTACATG